MAVVFEEEGNGARGAKAAVAFVKIAANIGDSPFIIVGRGLDEDGDTVWCIPFKQHFLEIFGIA